MSLKIIHCANFSESKNGAVFYSIDRKISNGLIRNGHFVYDFSYREISKSATLFKSKKAGAKKMNQALIQTIDNIKPDLLLLGHSEIIFEETLIEIKKLYPTIKIAMWWVDWLKNVTAIKSKLSQIDVLFTTTSVEEINDELLELKDKTFTYLPNMCDSSIESYKAFDEIEFNQDIFFAGRLDKEREDFITELKSKVNNYKFNIFGATKKSLLLGEKFLYEISKSKTALNISRDHNTALYTSDRIIQLMANGTLVFSKEIPKIDKLFEADEIIYFKDMQDCFEKIEFYLKNDDERIGIAKKGWKKAHGSYNSTRVTKFMLETIFNTDYSEEYEWKDELVVS